MTTMYMKRGFTVHTIKCCSGRWMIDGCQPIILQQHITFKKYNISKGQTIVQAHSFIMKGVSRTKSEVTESMYAYPASWSFKYFFSSKPHKRANSESIFVSPFKFCADISPKPIDVKSEHTLDCPSSSLSSSTSPGISFCNIIRSLSQISYLINRFVHTFFAALLTSFMSTKMVIAFVGRFSSTFFTTSSYSEKFSTSHASLLLL